MNRQFLLVLCGLLLLNTGCQQTEQSSQRDPAFTFEYKGQSYNVEKLKEFQVARETMLVTTIGEVDATLYEIDENLGVTVASLPKGQKPENVLDAWVDNTLMLWRNNSENVSKSTPTREFPCRDVAFRFKADGLQYNSRVMIVGDKLVELRAVFADEGQKETYQKVFDSFTLTQ